jgi:hypothetical protein
MNKGQKEREHLHARPQDGRDRLAGTRAVFVLFIRLDFVPKGHLFRKTFKKGENFREYFLYFCSIP